MVIGQNNYHRKRTRMLSVIFGIILGVVLGAVYFYSVDPNGARVVFYGLKTKVKSLFDIFTK
jgi:hypothetical protein